jgi:hypothetical protein
MMIDFMLFIAVYNNTVIGPGFSFLPLVLQTVGR